jgi:hypothetical protein
LSSRVAAVVVETAVAAAARADSARELDLALPLEPTTRLPLVQAELERLLPTQQPDQIPFLAPLLQLVAAKAEILLAPDLFLLAVMADQAVAHNKIIVRAVLETRLAPRLPKETMVVILPAAQVVVALVVVAHRLLAQVQLILRK